MQAGIWVERALNDEAPDPGPHRGSCWTHHQAAALRLKQVSERLKREEDLQKKVSDQFPTSYFNLFGFSMQAPVKLVLLIMCIGFNFKPCIYFFSYE